MTASATPHEGRAWAALLTQPTYLTGVRVLKASLARVGSPYPFVVVVTPTISAEDRALLEADGCLLREVAPIRPPAGLRESYANARFAEVWTKLAVWTLTEFERLVVLDADMLVVRNMDELFDLDLGPSRVAACHACRCNPNKIATYPASWTPEHCAYTHVEAGEPSTEEADPYVNGGTLVLEPDRAVFDELMAELAAVDDLSRYVFAEQDFLNEHFRGRWTVLPYVYNALKTLPFQHPRLWHDDEVKNLHFIIDKPWETALDPASRYHSMELRWWDVATDLALEPLGV
ncbi:Glycosyl transferase family 8 [Microlunatus sagamiharensis]|uniref:Glycosyl transferase family 8 n=1 Tax=Microlunatus sagamiharensis TaxID=546874 RepID=A0A1H2M112_9ACTN|nr:glycosyltransferase family 8 protein [Microlunatus sagamiharensis]SDU86206.1 Glycosyl transferase family 8 [Microlunatus sagamiharensis]